MSMMLISSSYATKGHREVFSSVDITKTLEGLGDKLGVDGVPTGEELTKKINDATNPPSNLSCKGIEEEDRLADLIAAEEEHGSDELEFSCDVKTLGKTREVVYNNINYQVPDGVTIEDFINQCVEGVEFSADKVKEKGEFDDFSNSKEVADMIKVLKDNADKCLLAKNKRICQRKRPYTRKDESKPTGYCLSYVKRGVVGGGFTKNYPPGVAARESGTQWKKMGFSNLLDDPKYKDMTPYTAPKGAILVYSGGKWGHVEVKASENEFISDYVGEKPIYDELNLPRRIIGIYVRK